MSSLRKHFFTIWYHYIIIIQVLFFPARPIYFSRFYYLPSQFYYFIVIFFVFTEKKLLYLLEPPNLKLWTPKTSFTRISKVENFYWLWTPILKLNLDSPKLLQLALFRHSLKSADCSELWLWTPTWSFTIQTFISQPFLQRKPSFAGPRKLQKQQVKYLLRLTFQNLEISSFYPSNSTKF